MLKNDIHRQQLFAHLVLFFDKDAVEGTKSVQVF